MTLELSYESNDKAFHKEISFPYEMTSRMFDEIVRQLTAVAVRVHQVGEGITSSDTINNPTPNRPDVPVFQVTPAEEAVVESKKKNKGKAHD